MINRFRLLTGSKVCKVAHQTALECRRNTILPTSLTCTFARYTVANLIYVDSRAIPRTAKGTCSQWQGKLISWELVWWWYLLRTRVFDLQFSWKQHYSNLWPSTMTLHLNAHIFLYSDPRPFPSQPRSLELSSLVQLVSLHSEGCLSWWYFATDTSWLRPLGQRS